MLRRPVATMAERTERCKANVLVTELKPALQSKERDTDPVQWECGSEASIATNFLAVYTAQFAIQSCQCRCSSPMQYPSADGAQFLLLIQFF